MSFHSTKAPHPPISFGSRYFILMPLFNKMKTDSVANAQHFEFSAFVLNFEIPITPDYSYEFVVTYLLVRPLKQQENKPLFPFKKTK